MPCWIKGWCKDRQAHVGTAALGCPPGKARLLVRERGLPFFFARRLFHGRARVSIFSVFRFGINRHVCNPHLSQTRGKGSASRRRASLDQTAGGGCPHTSMIS